MIPAPLTPELDDRSGHALAPLAVADAEGRPVLALVVQATFALFPDLAGRAPPLAPLQRPIALAGEHTGEPGRSSLRREPETAWFKPGTDLVLLGHAQAPGGEPVTQLDAGLRVGATQKIVRVFGDRAWTDTGAGLSVSGPQPFQRLPLVWERAFGGVDAADAQRRCEPRNPVGCGFVAPGSRLAGPQRMPNLEDPAAPLRQPGDCPPPAGFGFIAPHWQPRAALAGTYDAGWQASRAPRLPADFQPAFLNAAAPGLVVPGRLRGDEPVIVLNAAAVPRLAFALPGYPPPPLRIDWRKGGHVRLDAQLDTVVIDTDAMQLLLTWRAHVVLPARGLHAVAAIRARAGRPQALAGARP